MNQTEVDSIKHQVLALSHFARVKPRLFAALVQHFGSLERIMRADSGSLMTIEGMTTSAANRIAKAKNFVDEARQYLQALTDREIQTSSIFDSDHLRGLDELNNPPPLLFVRGRLPDNEKKTVTIVGSDNASSEGIELTTQLARRFSDRGVQVVSSLNLGIDAAAHLGAAAGKTPSYAVIESGFDHLFPEEHTPLAIDIAQRGGIISEYAPDIEYDSDNHRQSNRLLAAISQGVVVTEFYKDSHRVLDLLTCCAQIGKLCFVLIDPKIGAKSDQDALNKAVDFGALVMVGLDRVDDIVKSLV